jgi:hypothetical protein
MLNNIDKAIIAFLVIVAIILIIVIITKNFKENKNKKNCSSRYSKSNSFEDDSFFTEKSSSKLSSTADESTNASTADDSTSASTADDSTSDSTSASTADDSTSDSTANESTNVSPVEDCSVCTCSASASPVEDCSVCTCSASASPVEDCSVCTCSASASPVEDCSVCTCSASASQVEECSSASQVEDCSSASQVEECSSASQVEDCSSASQVEECSSASQVEECSSASQVEECSSASLVEECSSASLVEECSSASLVEELKEHNIIIPECNSKNPIHPNVFLVNTLLDETSNKGVKPLVSNYTTFKSIAGHYFPANKAGINGNNIVGNKSVTAIICCYSYNNLKSDLRKALISNNPSITTDTVNKIINNVKIFTLGENGRPGNTSVDNGWSIEGALDIQIVMHLAPAGICYFIQAYSNSLKDILNAIKYMTTLSPQPTSCNMSFGGPISSNSMRDISNSIFNIPNIIFCAASGDNGATGTESVSNSSANMWPQCCPNVISVGGTTAFTDAWKGSGGGHANVFTDFKDIYPKVKPLIEVTTMVENNPVKVNCIPTPNLCALADPNTGVRICNSQYNPKNKWYQLGGTSASAPIMAAFFALVNGYRASLKPPKKPLTQSQVWQTCYGNIPNGLVTHSTPLSAPQNTYFNDIKNGDNVGYNATDGFDLCTGQGSANAVLFEKLVSL